MGANRRYGDRSPLPDRIATPRVDRIRHVWVRPSATHDGMRHWAGLLVAWERRPDGWWAQVATVSNDQSLAVYWVPADRLTPVPGATSRHT